MADARAQLRWESIEDEQALALPGTGERITHPEFAGIEFLHVRAKSLLNHVPAAAGLPFEWTINTYRGCTHACTYCLAPQTPVLMLDGSHRPIADLRPGDRVYGTELDGPCRRYRESKVQDVWWTTKRAYRVVLADGTELVASGDHRFLTERGWKHVVGTGAGAGQRPHLTTNDRLLGTGRFEPASPLDADYRRGYLTGMIRGDANLKRYTRLRVTAVTDLGVKMPMVDITTETGDFIANGVVSHNCFARPSHEWLELDAGRDFESVIVVKVNAVERLRAELRSPRWQGAHVALGTNTDPYQRAEGRYRLTRGVVQTLSDAGNPFSLLTKGTLVTRDLDVLADAAARGVCTGVSLSIPTLDEDVWRRSEPGTPHPRARLEAVAAIAEAGIPAGVMIAPIMPGLSDGRDQLEQVVRGAIDAGASSITPIVLHLRPGVRELFEPWLADVAPDLVEHYRGWYADSYASAAVRERITGTVHELIESHGGPRRPPLRSRDRPRRDEGQNDDPQTPGQQLALL
ncbi:MAG: radical SAM protein [Actinomycetota bacterium]